MEPTTELDERFSDPGARPTPWAMVRQALESAETSWVTTVRSDGRPHVTPLVTVWLDDALYFCTGPTEQKAVNLRSNQNVVLTTGCNTWNEGLDVIVEGAAERVTDEAALATGRGVEDQVGWSVAFRGGQRRLFQHEGGAGEAYVFEVVPTKILSFAKETFAATRHTV